MGGGQFRIERLHQLRARKTKRSFHRRIAGNAKGRPTHGKVADDPRSHGKSKSQTGGHRQPGAPHPAKEREKNRHRHNHPAERIAGQHSGARQNAGSDGQHKQPVNIWLFAATQFLNF